MNFVEEIIDEGFKMPNKETKEGTFVYLSDSVLYANKVAELTVTKINDYLNKRLNNDIDEEGYINLIDEHVSREDYINDLVEEIKRLIK